MRLAFLSPKGLSGASLAQCLLFSKFNNGKKNLLIDASTIKSLDIYLGIDNIITPLVDEKLFEENSFENISKKINEYISESKLYSNVFLLKLATYKVLESDFFKSIIEALENEYNIVLDVSSVDVYQELNSIINFTNNIIIVTNQDSVSLRAFDYLISKLKKIEDDQYRLNTSFILNKYREQNGMDEDLDDIFSMIEDEYLGKISYIDNLNNENLDTENIKEYFSSSSLNDDIEAICGNIDDFYYDEDIAEEDIHDEQKNEDLKEEQKASIAMDNDSDEHDEEKKIKNGLFKRISDFFNKNR